MTAGIGGSGYESKLWTLMDLDREEDVVGQFIPQSVQRTVSGRIASANSPNSQYPIIQWVSGELETISFSAKLWATDSTDVSVDERLNRLEDLVKRNSDLKRPPICGFTWGNVPSLLVHCLVRSLGGITYDEVRDDGSLRGVSLQIELARYEEVEFEVTDPSNPERYTRVRRAKKGDTYESIALDEYGDPTLGILLRQLNPRVAGMDLADLNSKDPVHIFPEEYLAMLQIEPEFHAFKSGVGNEASEERRREIFEARGADKYVTYLGDTAEEEFS